MAYIFIYSTEEKQEDFVCYKDDVNKHGKNTFFFFLAKQA